MWCRYDSIIDPDFKCPTVNEAFDDSNLQFSDNDILDAIKEIKADSAPGPDGIPAILLKACASELCKPIRMIWERSISTSIVPDFYKNAHVAPLYKKGSRAEAGNYRPISLTSHIVKIYERVLRKTMVKYLESNNLLSSQQHWARFQVQ